MITVVKIKTLLKLIVWKVKYPLVLPVPNSRSYRYCIVNVHLDFSLHFIALVCLFYVSGIDQILYIV